jgi:ABC-type transport system involved in multi-copper enzyme maturation permease subunit
LYAFALLVFLLFVYAVWLDTVLIIQGAMAPRDLADFAASFFYVFAGLQLCVVVLLTPAYAAGVLAEEKERGTLEALLATDLRAREIVLGLFLARLANLTLLLLTGLPILSFLQFMGGVDPNLLVSAFTAAGCTMVSLASVSFLCSLYARRSRDAIVRSYLLSLGYLVLSGLSWVLLLPQLQLASFPSTDEWHSPVTLEDVVHWSNYGNIVSAAFQIAGGVHAGGALNDLLWRAMTKYAWFHGLIAAGCCVWAVVRMRAKALEQLAGDSDRHASLGRVRLGWRPLRDRPVFWKEIAAEVGDRRGLVGLLVNGCLLAVLAVPVLHVYYYYGRVLAAEPDSHLTDLINLWVRGASMLLGCLLLLQVAVRAAGSVSGERGRQTFDSLLVTSLDNREILAGKWLGSLLCPRQAWLALAVVWGIGLATGALHPLAPVCFVLAWLVYATFPAALGLWASVDHRSTHRALFWTLFLLGVALVDTWLAAWGIAERWLTEPQALSLSPPLALGLLMFSPADVKSWAEPKSDWSFLGIILGLVGWGGAAGVLWTAAKIRFRVVTGREARLVGRAEDGSPLPVVASVVGGQPAKTVADSSSGKVSLDPKDQPWETSPPRRFQLRPWLRVAGRTALVLSPLGLLIGEYVHLDGTADQVLREALAETDRLDPGWRLEELEAKRQIVPPEENSAQQVLKTKSLIPEEWWKNERDLVLLFEKLAPERQLSAKQLDALRTGLETVGAALVEARRLADMPRGRFPTVFREGGLWYSRYPHAQEARLIAKLLGYDVHLRAQEGDVDGALVSCRALLNTGRAIGDEPLHWSQLLRARLQYDAVLKTERSLAQGEPAEATLEALQRLLADEDRHPLKLIALRGERASTDLMLESVQKGPNLSGSFFEVKRGGAAVAPLPRGDELVMIASGSLKGQRAALLRVCTDLVEAAKLPPAQMDARLRQTMASLRGFNSPAAVRFFVPWVRTDPQHALMRSAMVALAAERYRRQHGRWPDTLDALVPVFLTEVPLDPHDGGRLRYRRLTEGIVIYSVGPDLTDNGGNLDRHNRTQSGTDVGVRLWDVNRRRQPPAPETTD